MEFLTESYPEEFSDRLFVHYQPQVSLSIPFDNGHVVTGFEALIRLDFNGKTILPGNFMPFTTPLQKMIVFKKVLSDIKFILDSNKFLNLADYSFGINVEPELLSSFSVLNTLRHFPKKYRKSIVLEILETPVPDFNLFVRSVIFVRKKLGFKLALDDFGSGGPSFRILPLKLIKTVKLDGFFIPGKGQEIHKKKETLMVKDVSNMLKNMGVSIMAEQIETLKDIQHVKKHVHSAQGFFWGRPAPFHTWETKIGYIVKKI